MELIMTLVDQDIVASAQAIVAHNKYEISEYKVIESLITNSVGDITAVYEVSCPIDSDLPIIYYDAINKEFRTHVQLATGLNEEEFKQFINAQQVGLEVLKFLNNQFCSSTGA